MLYPAVVGLSAFLLFNLQLFAGRLVVPIFGGSAGVWAAALSFFSFTLLLGYAYAHVVTARLPGHHARVAHLGVAVVVLVAVLLVPSDLATARIAGAPEVVSALLALALVAAAPSFPLSATTPLLSTWFAAGRRDPWWLFAASNAASFAALLFYPFLLEPLLPLSVQRSALMIGLAVFVLGLAMVVRGRRFERSESPMAEEEPAEHAGPGWRGVIAWFVAAFVPAGMLSATTNFLATDLASAPLLWVGPLGIYLASFAVAFSDRGRRVLPIVDRLVPAAAILLWLPFVAPVIWPAVPLIVVELACFAVLATAIHGRLAGARPSISRLTSFYLVIAAAGAAATAAVVIVAPLLFSDIYEYPLLIVAGLGVLALVGPATREWLPDKGDRRRVAVDLAWRVVPYLLVVALLLLVWGGGTAESATRLFIIGLLLLIVMATPRAVALVTPLVIIATIAVLSGSADATQVFKARSFYGVSEVVLADNAHALYSGTTVHGLQFLDERSSVPTTYYVEPGPLGDVFADLRGRTDGAHIGVIGLGVGTAAAYTQAGDSLSFFELDPAVVRIAHDTDLFTFLADSAVVPATVVGDGRLSVELVAAHSLDVLVIDAFSSGNVPPHLLTREALQGFMRVLRPGGLLAFHVSNRYYDLAPALAATARSVGLEAVQREYAADDQAVRSLGAADSTWVAVGSAEDIARMAALGWLAAPAGGPVLTDDYHDVTRLLRR